MGNRDEKIIRDEIEAARAAYLDAVATEPESVTRPLAAKVKDLQDEMSKTISAGADNCKDCGNAPLGMEQQGVLNGRVIIYYEVGCLVCRDHRAQGMTREEAVNNWNASEFLKAKSA